MMPLDKSYDFLRENEIYPYILKRMIKGYRYIKWYNKNRKRVEYWHPVEKRIIHLGKGAWPRPPF